MIEHRIIERMIHVVSMELERIQKGNTIDPAFIDETVDFIRIYADMTHHGKEEDILFKALKKKELNPEISRILNELLEEHVIGRRTVGNLAMAKEQHIHGSEKAKEIIVSKLAYLVDFYPKHIEKEDKHFFVSVMKHFSKEEQDRMLEEGYIYDRKMIHRKYDSKVLGFEEKFGIKKPKRSKNWLDYL